MPIIPDAQNPVVFISLWLQTRSDIYKLASFNQQRFLSKLSDPKNENQRETHTCTYIFKSPIDYKRIWNIQIMLV